MSPSIYYKLVWMLASTGVFFNPVFASPLNSKLLSLVPPGPNLSLDSKTTRMGTRMAGWFWRRTMTGSIWMIGGPLRGSTVRGASMK